MGERRRPRRPMAKMWWLTSPPAPPLLHASLAILAPLMCINIRASSATELMCSDASPFALGSVTTPIPEEVSRELWRHRDRRGHYTWLYGPVAASLAESGDDASAEVQAATDGASCPSVQGSLVLTFDFVEQIVDLVDDTFDFVKRKVDN